MTANVDNLYSSLPVTVGVSLPDGLEEKLHCGHMLRYLPGRRLVCAAEWQDREVVAKIFSGKRRKHDHQDEERGARLLQAAGILTPVLKYSGRLKDPESSVLIFERVAGAVSLSDDWHENNKPDERNELMRKAVSLLARHHKNGIRQKDLHLNNFLVSGPDIYTIDTAHIVRHKARVPVRHAIDNLAALLSQMYIDDMKLHHALFLEYEKAGGVLHDERNFARLQRAIRRWRRRLRRNLYNKIFRECTAFSYRRIRGVRQIVRREYITPELKAYLDNIDKRFDVDCDTFLKQGRSSTVCVSKLGGVSFVIKRYNIKGLLTRIRKSFRKSRAARSWRNAHLLDFHGINTARPVAMIERREGLLPGVSYFISEYVDGDNALEYFRAHDPDSSSTKKSANQLARLVNRMGSLQLSHGDMKATNFVITDSGPVLMDLDDLVQHRLLVRARRAHMLDIERFMRNWQDMPQVRDLFDSLVRSGVG